MAMMEQNILGVVTLFSTVFLPVASFVEPLVSPMAETRVLVEHTLDLTIREPNPYANQVFTDNILLSLHYLKGDVDNPKINWEKVRQPFEVSFTLKPGEVFSFHGNVLPEFKDPVVTMNSRFFMEEGYKSVGGLGGNGVCHLASLINWTASNAGLKVMAPVNHNFALVPGIPHEFGTSIMSQSPNQNLYIQNNFDFPVTFKFEADQHSVVMKIVY